MATWIVGGVLLGLVVLTVTHMIRQRRKAGESNGCTGGCAGCPYSQETR